MPRIETARDVQISSISEARAQEALLELIHKDIRPEGLTTIEEMIWVMVFAGKVLLYARDTASQVDKSMANELAKVVYKSAGFDIPVEENQDQSATPL